MAGRSTNGTLFAYSLTGQLQEKNLAKKMDLWMALVDLKEAFDRVPLEVVW